MSAGAKGPAAAGLMPPMVLPREYSAIRARISNRRRWPPNLWAWERALFRWVAGRDVASDDMHGSSPAVNHFSSSAYCAPANPATTVEQSVRLPRVAHARIW